MTGSHEVRGSNPLISTNYAQARGNSSLFYYLRSIGAQVKHLVDMHMHLGFAKDPTALAKGLDEAGASAFANTVTPGEYEALLHVCAPLENVRLGIGLHPWWIDAEDRMSNDDMVEDFCNALASTRFVGEVGLDFSGKRVGSKEQQMRCFKRIAASIADRDGLLISIHAVQAVGPVLEVLEEVEAFKGNAIVFHSFSGSSDQLARAMRLGASFSIGSRLLASKRGREYARIIPIESLLLESDLPSHENQSIDASEIVESLASTLENLALIRETEADEFGAYLTERSLELLGFQG